jgi:hypothetical protein
VSGVVLFGLVIWYLSRQRTVEGIPPDIARSLNLAFGALAVGALIAISFVRSAQSKAATLERRGALAVAAWALAEGVALYGGVIYLLTAGPALYLIGLVILVATFVIVPAPEES